MSLILDGPLKSARNLLGRGRSNFQFQTDSAGTTYTVSTWALAKGQAGVNSGTFGGARVSFDYVEDAFAKTVEIAYTVPPKTVKTDFFQHVLAAIFDDHFERLMLPKLEEVDTFLDFYERVLFWENHDLVLSLAGSNMVLVKLEWDDDLKNKSAFFAGAVASAVKALKAEPEGLNEDKVPEYAEQASLMLFLFSKVKAASRTRSSSSAEQWILNGFLFGKTRFPRERDGEFTLADLQTSFSPDITEFKSLAEISLLQAFRPEPFEDQFVSIQREGARYKSYYFGKMLFSLAEDIFRRQQRKYVIIQSLITDSTLQFYKNMGYQKGTGTVSVDLIPFSKALKKEPPAWPPGWKQILTERHRHITAALQLTRGDVIAAAHLLHFFFRQ